MKRAAKRVKPENEPYIVGLNIPKKLTFVSHEKLGKEA